MKKIIFINIFFVFITIFGCSDVNVVKNYFTSDIPQIYPHLKELLLEDGFTIEEEDPDSGILVTNWKKMEKEENNIPDPTIEGKIEIQMNHLKNETEVLARIRKRSKLAAINSQKGNDSYEEVGIILNDLLYKRWKEKLNELKKKLEK